MQRLGIDQDEIAALLKVAEEDNATDGLSLHQQHVLHDLMSNTFFMLSSPEQPCQTSRGTRPGDPIADILFNLCMSLVLRNFHAYMAAHSSTPWIGQAQQVSDYTQPVVIPPEGFIDVTFVGDCADDSIVEVVQLVVQAFVTAAGKRGLEINFDMGEAELLWNMTGKGAKAMKSAMQASHDVLTWISNNRTFSVHLCHQYKHLGTWVQTRHRHAREISLRASSAKQQWGQLARPFFTKKAVSMQV